MPSEQTLAPRRFEGPSPSFNPLWTVAVDHPSPILVNPTSTHSGWYGPSCQTQPAGTTKRYLSTNPSGCASAVCIPTQEVKFSDPLGCGCARNTNHPLTPDYVPRYQPCDKGNPVEGGRACAQIYSPTCGCQIVSVHGNTALLACNTYSNQCAACTDPKVAFTYEGRCPFLGVTNYDTGNMT